MNYLRFTVLVALLVSLASLVGAKDNNNEEPKKKAGMFAKLNLKSLTPDMTKNPFPLTKKDDLYYYQKINRRLCEKPEQDSAEGYIEQAKEILVKLESQAINKANANLGLNTSDIRWITNLEELIRPHLLDQDLQLCEAEATKTLEQVAHKSKSTQQDGCNKVADIYNYYVDRRRSNCFNQYLETFDNLKVDHGELVHSIKLNFEQLVCQLTGVTSGDSFSLESLNSSPRTNKHSREIMDEDKEILFKGMLRAFVDYKRHNLEDPFGYSGANEQVADELLFRFQLSPCQRYLSNFGRLFGALNFDLDASRQLGKPLDLLSEAPSDFYHDWLLYDVCSFVVPEVDGGFITEGYKISPEMLMDLVVVLHT